MALLMEKVYSEKDATTCFVLFCFRIQTRHGSKSDIFPTPLSRLVTSVSTAAY
jgi:hypothetical protein